MSKGRKKGFRLLLVSLAATSLGSGVVWAPTASAQLIGPCPSPLMPPPCIINDPKKLVEKVQEYAKQVERLREMVKQVQSLKENTNSIAGNIKNVKTLIGAWQSIAPGNGGSNSTMVGDNVQATIANYGKTVYDNPGVGVDVVAQTSIERKKEAIRANADSVSMAAVAKAFAVTSQKRLACLSQAVQTSGDLRGDWALNSQTRVELLRQQAQRDHLFSVYLQNASINRVQNTDVEAGENIKHGTVNAAPPLEPRSPAWNMRDRLRQVEGLIRSTVAAYAIAQNIQSVVSDAKNVTDRYANVEQRREQTLNAFRTKASSWDSRRAGYIVDTTVAELNNLDTRLKALREAPVEQLGAAFRERNIDAPAMIAQDIDPRQFIGTWGDPLKNKMILDMANALLDGRLDPYIDGDSDNDEYRELLLAYNEARLEEAWMRNYASDAANVGQEVVAIGKEESESIGYDLTTENTRRSLEALIAEANSLGQQIQQTGEEVPTQQAADILKSINALLSGSNETPTSVGTTPTVIPTGSGFEQPTQAPVIPSEGSSPGTNGPKGTARNVEVY